MGRFESGAARNLRKRGWRKGTVEDYWHHPHDAWFKDGDGCTAVVSHFWWDKWHYEVTGNGGRIMGEEPTIDKAVYLCEVAMRDGFPMYEGSPEAGLDYLVTVYALTEHADTCRVPKPSVQLASDMQYGCWSALSDLFGAGFRGICRNRGWVDEDGDPDGYVQWLSHDRAVMYGKAMAKWKRGCEVK